ncbi:MAG: winged helix-turn-helix transcriptional regulator [Candidatus Omnitrophica bacterium]|nr:winged helix-turn-helix transcriptional regulator [Candidatus Omnitrophota bacterium]
MPLGAEGVDPVSGINVADGHGAVQQTTQKTTQKTTRHILALMRKDPHITRQELAKVLALTDEGIKYNLRNMQRDGILKRVGADKGGHWEVLVKE